MVDFTAHFVNTEEKSVFRPEGPKGPMDCYGLLWICHIALNYANTVSFEFEKNPGPRNREKWGFTKHVSPPLGQQSPSPNGSTIPIGRFMS